MVALFLVAGGDPGGALTLGVAMLALQCSIGAVNDVVDARDDARVKPSKPIPMGLVSRRTAATVGIVGAIVGLVGYLTFGVLVFAMGAAMLGCGLAYDLWLKRAGLGALAFAVAFPLLPLSTWYAAAGTPPPHAELLLPIAALAGPTLQLANSLVDLERDEASGIRSGAVRLGRRRAVALLAGLVALVYGIAWVTLVAGPAVPLPSLALAGCATVLAVAGVILSGREAPASRERGWEAQAAGIALLAAGWLSAAV